MKASDLRELKNTEVALVRDHKKGLVMLANHNSEFGMCDCCKDWSLADAEVIMVCELDEDKGLVTHQITL